ncbi:olfactory receptor 5G9-like [Pelobates fuscus]|uniref:olfactory receptor 5G9-like n=1 Tax=Pelobates fuscus TaxID=191477 RepID=UPI002FE4F590
MEEGNQTTVTKFIFLGVTNDANMQIFLFILFLLIYILTAFGNISTMVIITVISNLHSPMYFFLSNLSASDLCFSTVVTPKCLHDMFLQRKSISFIGCALQLYFFILFGCTECYILSAMAYDRYVAICHPLLYIIIMNKSMCIFLVTAVYTGGFLTAGIDTYTTITLPFCGPNTINHFYCDIPPLMDLACSDSYINKTIIFAVVFVLGFLSVTVILASYTYIFFTIIKIRSIEGRQKAFSTCSSHLLCVSVFYGTVFFMYLRPASGYSVTQNKVIPVFYTMVIPMLNPIIYSLRNKEVQETVRYYVKKRHFPRMY